MIEQTTLVAEWNHKLHRSEPLPTLLTEFLQEAVRDGRLRPGERLPAESDFAEQLGVSRATWRAAVQSLVAQGILERRHGVGTFVADNALLAIEEGLETLTSTTEVIRKHGFEPGTVEFEVETIPASSWLSETLHIDRDTPILHISRTRTANQRPVIHCEEYISTTLLSPKQLPDDQTDWSLYHLITATGESLASAVCNITAVAADELIAHKLDVPVNFPLLLMQQTHLNDENEPILFCKNYHNTTVIEFQVLRRG